MVHCGYMVCSLKCIKFISKTFKNKWTRITAHEKTQEGITYTKHLKVLRFLPSFV